MTKHGLSKAVIVAVLSITAIGAIMLAGCATFGTTPKGNALERVQQSPQYNVEQQQFLNPIPIDHEAISKDALTFSGLMKFIFINEERTPDDQPPEIVPDILSFASRTGRTEAIWFGHSTVLMRMANKNILFDPVFGSKASPVPFTVSRFQEPVLSLGDLPEIDYIVISHDHYDHLDMETIEFFRDKKTQFLVPIGVGSHLRGWGIESDRITELDWWQTTQRGELEFVCTPAYHFSGRGLNNRNKTLWSSWVVRDTKESIYFSGDSGYAPHFKDIGYKYGPFDLAFIETGQYNNRWRAVHMLPEEAAQAYVDLKAQAYIPIHWAMFNLAMHTWYQPALEISEQARQHSINLITPKLGEIVSINQDHNSTPWWTPWVDPNRPLEWYAEKVY